MVDLLAETSDVEEIRVSKVFVDNLATCKGSGVGILLVSPQRDEI